MNSPDLVSVGATPLLIIRSILGARLTGLAAGFLSQAERDIRELVDTKTFCRFFSMSSRHAKSKTLLSLSSQELENISSSGVEWNPKSWSLLEAVRIYLLLYLSQNVKEALFEDVYERCFKHADQGELCALYKALPLLRENGGDHKRFFWRAAEGCRSNMQSIFESVACESSYPVRHFSTVAWNQLVVKALFLNVPLWRVYGLDGRLSEELSRIVSDLIEEKTSAGRDIPNQLWLCFGPYANQRVLTLMEQHFCSSENISSNKAIIYALARADKVAMAEQLVTKMGRNLSETLGFIQNNKVIALDYSNL